MSYGLYDPQDQNPICYCAHCQGEIYQGNICYPINGWQMLCPECNDELDKALTRFEYAGYDEGGIKIK